MDKHGTWSLAPAYDMVYSIDPNTLGIQKGQLMSIKGKVLDITENERYPPLRLRNPYFHLKCLKVR